MPACLADAGKPTTRCDFPADGDPKVTPYNATIRGLAGRAPRVSIFDPVPIGCRRGVCPALWDGIVVHRDDNHLSATFVRAHATAFGAALQRADVDLATLSRRRRSR